MLTAAFLRNNDYSSSLGLKVFFYGAGTRQAHGAARAAYPPRSATARTLPADGSDQAVRGENRGDVRARQNHRLLPSVCRRRGGGGRRNLRAVRQGLRRFNLS